jgi:hypothetical protein
MRIRLCFIVELKFSVIDALSAIGMLIAVNSKNSQAPMNNLGGNLGIEHAIPSAMER